MLIRSGPKPSEGLDLILVEPSPFTGEGYQPTGYRLPKWVDCTGSEGFRPLTVRMPQGIARGLPYLRSLRAMRYLRLRSYRAHRLRYRTVASHSPHKHVRTIPSIYAQNSTVIAIFIAVSFL
jgi:hypothetical protein